MTVPDIFLSYNREDSERAKQFAEGFAAQGLEVWWDVALRSGEAYDEVTEAALRGAKAVVVLWSQKSVISRWVRAEATLAERKKTLMPAMIEPCERPIMFELTQTADLSHWTGDTSDTGWRDFARHVREFVGKDRQAAPVETKPGKPLPRLDQLSVVVLPFNNMSGDPEQEYFADGISEDIITDLSKVSALTVISRNSAFTFKGKHVDIPDVARQLNVTHVVEGSVRKAGDRVRVTAQLIDGSTNGHIWADRWDRDLDDIFALQDELSQAIVGALKIKLLPEEKKAIEDRGTDNVEAYDMFMRGWTGYQTEGQGTERPTGFMRAAVALDPNYSRAWECLAAMCRDAAYVVPGESERYLADSDAAFARALATVTDPERALVMRAVKLFSVENDWLGADEAFAEAARLAPPGKERADTQHAIFLAHTGRLNEAIDEFQACLRLDPMLSPPIFNVLLDATGRPAEADAEYRRERKIGTVPPLIDFFDLIRILARGDREASRRRFELFLADGSSFFPPAAGLFANFDDPAKALALLREHAKERALRNPTHLSSIALIAAWLGDIDFATECLATAFVEMRSVAMALLWHPLLAEVRRTEGFKRIMRDLGQYDYWRASGEWGDFARPVGDDDFEIIA